MTDYDWEVRLSDPGVTVDLQGDSTETLANGITVTYQDIATGNTNVLTPDDHPELRDPTPRTRTTRTASSTGRGHALGAEHRGRRAADRPREARRDNQPKAPGSITVQGHIRDRAGHWQPVLEGPQRRPHRDRRPPERPAAPRRRDRLPARHQDDVHRGRLDVQAPRRRARPRHNVALGRQPQLTWPMATLADLKTAADMASTQLAAAQSRLEKARADVVIASAAQHQAIVDSVSGQPAAAVRGAAIEGEGRQRPGRPGRRRGETTR
jgi:hypothetical protein